MKLMFLILSISTGLGVAEKLKCFECSENVAQNDKKCSVNQTRYSEASVDTGEVFDKVFEYHKSIVSLERYFSYF